MVFQTQRKSMGQMSFLRCLRGLKVNVGGMNKFECITVLPFEVVVLLYRIRANTR